MQIFYSKNGRINMMKRALKLTILLIIFSILITKPIRAEENRVGVHILDVNELPKAAELVNNQNRQWGFVTIPIQKYDRNLEKWQAFMNQAKKLQVQPILRLATYPLGENWTKPDIFDPLDWANFLASLDWPTANKYIIVYNEVNDPHEWGGLVNPEEYTNQFLWTREALKNYGNDFIVMNAGLNPTAPQNGGYWDEYVFLNNMEKTKPGILDKFDVFASHSYPADYTGSPQMAGRNSIRNFETELTFLQNYYGLYGKKVMVTETGWKTGRLSNEKVANYYKDAFQNVWNKDYMIAITPFLLNAGAGDFMAFSLTDKDFKPLPSFLSIQAL